MNIESNVSIARRFLEQLWNARRLELADEIVAPDCVTHQLRWGLPAAAPRDPETLRHHIHEWVSAFPDLHYTIEQVIAQGDFVMMQCMARGTHTGFWRGVAPTGRTIEARMVITQRIADGRIAEDWVLVDFLGFFQQLGLVPPTAELLSGRHATAQ